MNCLELSNLNDTTVQILEERSSEKSKCLRYRNALGTWKKAYFIFLIVFHKSPSLYKISLNKA